jgi:hypothetical protein
MIYEKLNSISTELNEVNEHIQDTNGRVTALEKKTEYLENKSLGVWVGENPFRVAVIFTVVVAIIILSSLVGSSLDGVMLILQALV